MFIGEYIHSVDSKGRVSIPAKFRRDVREGVVVTRGLDHCLVVYPKNEWEALAKKFAGLPVSSRKSRAFARLMLAGAWDADLDAQGRIMIPEYLRSYASITKIAVVCGLYNRMEIWDEDRWGEYKHQTEAESDAIAESMSELGV